MSETTKMVDPDDIWDTHGKAGTGCPGCARLTSALAAAERQRDNLLARIFRDGGQKQSAFATVSEACEAADSLCADYIYRATFFESRADEATEALASANAARKEAEDGRDALASRLIDAWVADKGRKIPWAKAVQIIAIITKQSDAERDRLLHMGDEDGSCEMCGRRDHEATSRLKEVEAALGELVRLKDMNDWLDANGFNHMNGNLGLANRERYERDMIEYMHAKPLAWSAASALVLPHTPTDQEIER